MIELHTAQTSNGQRVAVMLEECGLAYRVRSYALMKGEHRTPEFRAITPAGRIPVIVDDDGPGGQPVTLTQSAAILVYLAQKAGRFLPSEPLARTRAFEWLFLAMTDVVPSSSSMFYDAVLLPDKSEANVAWHEARLVDWLRLADARLADREWLADELSIADFALYPVTVVRRSSIERIGGLPRLERWQRALAARPGVARGMAAAEPDR